MQLKLVLSLAFLAFCSARSIDYDYYVNVEDGHVTVENKAGQVVDIYVKQHVGKSGYFIQIHVTGPGVELHSQKYVNEPVSFEGQYQADALYQIFNKYQGPLDEVAYEKLLNQVAHHVEENHVHPAVLYALQKLSPHHQTADLINPVHQDVYNTIHKLFQHIGLDQAVQVPYKHGVLGDVSNIHDWDEEAYPGVYGSRKWANYPGVSGVKSWAHQYGSEYPSVYGTKNWAHQYGSRYPGVSGVQSWGHQYGSEYPSEYGTKSWAHQYGSHYPGVTGVQSWAHQYGSHYPGLSGVQSWGHQYGAEHLSPYGSKSWAHQYGSHYPGVTGVQDWTEEGFGSHYPGVYGSAQSYGPFSSHAYDSGVAHGYGQHHYSSSKQWPHGDSWTHPVQHEVVAY